MMRRTHQVIVSEYDPTWPEVAIQVAATIEEECGDALLRVEHIGSTSVPGLAAKPVIDLAPVVAAYENGARCIQPIIGLGYEHRGEYGIPGRRYFRGTDARSGLLVHIHLYPRDAPELRRHLLFRDYLRAHSLEADAYAEVKRALAEQLWVDSNEYADAKTTFISACLERAEAWADETGWSSGLR